MGTAPEAASASPQHSSTNSENIIEDNHSNKENSLSKADQVVNVPEEDKDGDKKKKKGDSPPFSNYWRVLSYGSKIDSLIFLVGVTSACTSGVVMPLMNIVFGNLVGNFNGYFTPGNNASVGQFKSTVDSAALKIVYLFIARFATSYISMFCFRMAGLRITAAMRLAYIKAVFAQPISKLDEISSGTVATTITSSSNEIQSSITDRSAQLFQSLALLVAAYVVAFRYSWALTLVSTSCLVFMVLIYSFTVPVLIKLQRKVDKADEKVVSIATSTVKAVRTVFSLGAEPSLTRKHGTWVEETKKRGLQLSLITGVQFGPFFFATYANYALTFWFGIKLYADGTISSINTVVIVIFSVIIVSTIMGGIVMPVMQITKAISASQSFFDLIDAPAVSEEGIKAPDVSAHADIEFRDVCFAYPSRSNVPILKNFNARIEKGKTTALVGPSGSGKSTIVALLERWYQLGDGADEVVVPPKKRASKTDEKEANQDGREEPKPNRTSGAIYVDGHNLNGLDRKWWRAQIGLVQQEPFLFNDTISNNIAFGLIGSEWEDASEEKKKDLVKEACKEAFADEFIQRLPQGYDTMVGEGGIKLSGGQRQRIAIARSIVKRPAILVLDEATSSIDVHAEKIVQEALDRVSKDRTTVMIAHRLSTIRKADHIVVLHNGSKVEEGTHEELLAIPDGMYHNLVNAQQLAAMSAPAGEAAEQLEDADLILEKSVTRKSTNREEQQEEETGKKRGDFASLGRIIIEQRSHAFYFVLVIIAAMCCGGAMALQSWFFARIIQVFQYTGEKLRSSGNFWALMYFVLALAEAVAYFTLGYSTNTAAVYTANAYKNEYFQNILKQSIPYYDKEENAAGSLISRLTTDPRVIQDAMGAHGAFPLISIFTMLGSIIIAFAFGWKLTVVVLFGALPVLFIAAFFRLRHEIKFDEMNAKVFAHSSQFASEAIGAFRTVSSLTMEARIIDRFEILLRQQIKKALIRAWHASLVYALSDSAEFAAMALTFWYGGQLLADREYSPTSFFVIYTAIIQGGQFAGQFFSFAPYVARAAAAANRILTIRSQSASKSDSATEILPAERSGKGAEITLKNVSFKYPTRDAPIFHHLNVHIESGQFVAFVGPSGCGKTTIISLLERFYNASSGTVSFDKRDIRTIELSSYRRQLSLVAQEPQLFDGTIRENLVLGLEDDDVSDERIHQACKDAEIHDFILSLPNGYGTDLGVNAHTSLSGGQKQRLCIARALLRTPSLLLLDEATSSLDSQSEKLVQGALERLAGQRRMTIIAVAHRLATIQKADVIFVFSESEVGRGSHLVEQGSHEELIRRRGTYWQMCQAQALDQ